MFWTTHPTMTIWEKGRKNIPHWRPRIDLWLVLDWRRNNKHCLLAISLLPPKPDLRAAQLARLQWLVRWSVPTQITLSARSQVFCCSSRQLLSGRWPSCSVGGSITCQRLSLHARVELGAPGSPPWKNNSPVLHKCGISPRCAETCTTEGWRRRTVHRSWSLSLHLSLDFPNSGSPGVSHLGHQLNSRVNCSSKWSAKQCKKESWRKKRLQPWSAAMLTSPGHDKIGTGRHKQVSDEWRGGFA